MTRLVAAVLTGLLLAAGAALADITVECLPASVWGQADAAIGLAGGVVEDFENTALAPGLTLEIAGFRGALTGTGSASLPAVFDPVDGDPFGSSFAAGVWDGSRVLVNTTTNQSQDYGSQDWRAVGLYVPDGAVWIAVACQQVTVDHTLMVNGTALGPLSGFGFVTGPGRNGVLIVRSDDPAAPVTRVSFGGGGDAFVLDHVVFQPAGSVPVRSASWGAVKALFR